MELSAKEGRSAGAGHSVGALGDRLHKLSVKNPEVEDFQGPWMTAEAGHMFVGDESRSGHSRSRWKALRGRGDLGASGAGKGGDRSIRGVRGSQDEHPWK